MTITPFKLARALECPKGVVDFNISASDCEPLTIDELFAITGDAARHSVLNTSLGFVASKGSSNLRDEIAGLYKEITSDQILASSPQELMYLAYHSILQPGDHVICMFPAYQALYQIAKSIGCEISTWNPSSEDDVRFDLGDFRELLRPNTRLVVINFPHNPSGFVLNADDLRQLISLSEDSGAWIFSDEIYRDLTVDEEQTVPSAIELSERAIVLNGLSKSYGLFGLRIGWIACRTPDIFANMQQHRDYTSQFNSAASEALAIIALQYRDELLSRSRRIVKENKSLVSNFANRWSDEVNFQQPMGGSMCLLRFNTLSADEFCQRALKEYGVLVAPLSLYDYGDRHVRLGLGRKGLEPAFDRLNNLMNSLLVKDS